MSDARVTLLASHLGAKGEASQGALPGAAAALHAGRGPSLNPKLWPCEDSLVLAALPGGELLACVADAHWGGSAGEAFTERLPDALAASPAAPATRLYRALLELEREYHAERDPGDRSESTVLAALVQDGALAWLSVGDSLLVHLPREGSPRLLNERNSAFLGNQPLAELPPGLGWSAGKLSLEPGDLVLLASDGLEPDVSGLSLPEVVPFLRGPGALAARLEALVERASDPLQGGGRDNLALIAIEAGA
ncbi:MAG: PP2C family serine/threonine-protein phosphatase [Planctomycetota bacterium]